MEFASSVHEILFDRRRRARETVFSEIGHSERQVLGALV